MLQAYLNGVTNSLLGGQETGTNYDAVTGTSITSVGPGTNYVFGITDINSVGDITSGNAAGAVSVPSGVTQLAVQDPGAVTVDGVSSTNFALFGANSNVVYNASGGSASIFAAGGSDSIFASGSGSNDTVISAGNDSVNFNGTDGADQVDAVGNATTQVFIGGSDVATVTASDNAKVSVVFHTNAGGNLEFINNSSQAQTVYSGSYTTAGGGSVYAPNSITVFGGAGGGYYNGGRSGLNYLNGGTGNSTLIGGGQGDTLVAGGQSNDLFGGAGGETLVGNGVANNFFTGLEEAGIGSIQAVGGLVSANGSGAQNFLLGNVDGTTLTGSTVTGSANIFDVLGTYTTSGGQGETYSGGSFTISDFGGNDTIALISGQFSFGADAPSVESIAGALGGGTQLLLTDGTVITLKGVSTSNINVSGGGHIITYT
ncbi:MAG TPA: calcium-binding protein [Acidocella sp.]|nr:calcium-binding protein [Acidocella sp.]